MKKFLLFALLTSVHVFAQKSDGFRIDSIPKQGILLDKGWKWHAGDKPDFAKADFDDSAWVSIDPTKTIPQLNQIDKQKPLWLRTKLISESNKELVLSIVQSGASEIFLNGNLIFSFGQIKKNNQSTVAYDPQNDAFILKLQQQVSTLAVRYFFQDKLRYNSAYNINFPLFSATINNKVLKSDFRRHIWNGFNLGVPFILFIVHLIFFLFYSKNKTNLWYSLSSLFGFVTAFLLLKLETTHSVVFKNQLINYAGGLGVLQNTLIYYTIYLFLKQKNLWLVIVFALGSLLGVMLNYFDYFQSSVLFNYLLTTFYVSSVIYMGNHARKQGESGGKYLIISMIIYIIFWSLFILSFTFGWGAISNDILFHLAALILPIIISALLGLDFRNTNNLLLKNLEKINIISAEKQQILFTQNETLEKQVEARTSELVLKNRDLEIETALERVRSRTMAMHNSDQLAGVMSVLCKEILNLGIHSDDMETCYITTFENTEPIGEIYFTTSNGDLIPHSFRARYDEDHYFMQIFETWKSGDSSFFLHSEGDELLKHFAFLYTSIPQDSPIIELRSEDHRQLPSELFNYILYFSQGYLDVVTRIAVPEYFDVFKRFGGALQQAYTRFLDLQKAENQAREAQIEAALERVRSRSMAMHKSEELVEVINVVAEQLLQLDFRLNTASFFLCDESEEFTFWLAAIGESNSNKIVIPKLNNPALTNIKEAQLKGLDFFSDTLTFEEKNEWFQHVIDHSEMDRISEERKQYILNSAGYARSLVLMKEIGLFIVNYESIPYSVTENAILIRFAKVFEQAYTRFLDLQKAEAQAREAQIEAALEKIRGRSLAMHHSDELKDVMEIVFQKMKELDVITGTIAIQFFDMETKDSDFWVSNDLQNIAKVKQPYDEKVMKGNNYMVDCWAAKIKGENIINKLYTFEQKNEWFDYVFANNDFETIPQTAREFITKAPNHICTLIIEKNAALCADNWFGQYFSKDEIEVLKRVAKVFEQAYTRFLDLQKAEAQAREAQIQLAMERVRARTMAMQHSDELADASFILDSQIRALGIKTRGCGFNIYGNNESTEWFSSETGTMPTYKTPRENVFLRYYEEGQKGKQLYIESFEGEACAAHYDYFSTLPIMGDSLRKFKESGGSLPAQQIDHVVYFKYGYLLFITLEPVPEAHDIFIRFAKVFEQTYTRFLDLQKAEEQAREAQIEAALEKIRSRSLAMHHSAELKEVMTIMFEKLTELDVLFGTTAIQLFDEKNQSCDFWLGTFIQASECMILPFDEKIMKVSGYMKDSWEAKRTGQSFFNRAYTLEEKNRYFEYVFTHNNERVPPPVKEFILGNPTHNCCLIIEKNSALFADRWDGGLYSEEMLKVLRRAAVVFEQAYVRFLDLKKAEAQAREAQIESALERVRSASLAIQQSRELEKVVVVLFDKLKELGVPFHSAFIYFFEKSTRNIEAWVATESLTTPIKVNMPFDESVANNQIIVDLWYAIENGEHGLNKSYKEKDKDDYYRYEAKYNQSLIPESITDLHLEAESWTTTFASEKNSIVGIDSWDGSSTTVEDFEILKRFAKVFEQAYVRFLDLQKAEAQAREAQIEVALERVRSRSMAMHKSDEVLDVANTLYETLQNLGFQYGACTIMIMDKKTGDMEHWVAGFEHLKYPKSYRVGYFKNPAFDAQLAAWHNGETFLVHKLEGEEKREYDEKMFTQTEYENFPEKEKKWMSEAESVIFSLAYMKHGALHWGPSELSHEQVNILQRFARVFEQTYTRFLDLQKSEAQARESQIQLAMERVRARTMAMQKSDELREVTIILYDQLKNLGFDFGASAITLMDANTGDMDWWMEGTNDGFNFLKSYHVKYFNHKSHIEQLENWKSGISYAVVEISGEEKKSYDKVYFNDTDFVQVPQETKELMMQDETVVFSMAYFYYGSLSWSPSPLNDEQANILQRFAKVFEQTYTRFLDLQKAEEQAKEAQIEVALEKIRARALAMHSSHELYEVAQTLRAQMGLLNQPELEASVIHLYDIENGVADSWHAYRPPGIESGEITSGKFQFRFDESALTKLFLQQYESNLEAYTIEAKGEILRDWAKILFEKSPDIKKYAGDKIPDVGFHHFSKFSGGALLMVTRDNPSEIVRYLQKRAASVFDFAYKRFLDLQKAEEQAREAQIEVALERVRARAMSMQKSDELADAAQILYHEFGKLGINTFTCGYMFVDENKQNQTAWVTLPDGTILPNYIDFPLTGDDVLDKRYASWKAKKPLHIHQVEGKENKTHHEFLTQHVPENVAKDIFDEIPESIIFYSSNFSNGYLLILATDFFSQEEEQIIIRFTKVFELTYTRFLDLELAESQAREAQIEVALERVRSKTLAMQSSVELSTIIGLIFNEMRKLDVQLQRCFFMIFNPQNLGVTWWMASFESVDLGKGYFIPYSEHRPQLAYLKGWQERQETWRHHMQGEEKASWDAFLFNDTEFKTLPPFVIDNMKSFKSIHLEASFNSFGCLTTGNEQPLSSEAFDLLIRFSKVFDLTYTRFNDITVAEAQTREAQIEVAFERIRASALAMQTSDEFLGVVKTLYMQLNTLGKQELEATTIQFYDLEKGFINSWHAQNIDKLTEGNISLGTTQIPLDACELTLEWLDAYKSSLEDYTIVAKGEKLKEWLRLLVSISPEIKDRLGNSMPEISHFHFSEFSEGALSMVSLKPFSEESKYLLKRAASAFDLAYKRYLDLQMKEEQSLKLAEEKQRLEAALKKLKATQAQLIQSEKLASLGELTAGIAHEIQNPLNFVNNFSEVSIELANELLDTLRQRGIEADSEEGELVSDLIQNQEKIHHHGKRASSIVKGMLEHSRKNSGNKELTDINALADEYLKLSYHGLRAKDHNGPTGTPERARFKSDFKTDFDIKLPKILIVPQDIGRVLLNLINNAFQAPPALNGRAKLVIVKTQFLPKEGGKGDVLISVIDNGSGVSPEIKSKIFQPFFTTKPTGEGTGLGLSLAYDIVTKGHGGTIECESVEGEGTEFIVKLPI